MVGEAVGLGDGVAVLVTAAVGEGDATGERVVEAPEAVGEAVADTATVVDAAADATGVGDVAADVDTAPDGEAVADTAAVGDGVADAGAVGLGVADRVGEAVAVAAEVAVGLADGTRVAVAVGEGSGGASREAAWAVDALPTGEGRRPQQELSSRLTIVSEAKRR